MDLKHKAYAIAALRHFQEAVIEQNPTGYEQALTADMRRMLTNLGEFAYPTTEAIDEAVEAIKQL